ncbi:MAG: metal-dependent hydrolase [Candidatus Acidiferrum sp.]
MDTITHGIAGALIGKAVFGGRDLFSPKEMSKQRLVTWAVMVGSIFPDSDVFRDMFSGNPLLMITWHRSVTHSLVMLPVWAVLLALLTRAIAQWRDWEAPRFAALAGLYAVGILSHIYLDLLTTYGTMIWSPLAWSRPAWDVLFIVDFTFTAILLVPQLLAWVYEEPERAPKRAIILWAVFTPVPLIISRLALAVGTPISKGTVLFAMVFVAVVFILPVGRGWGLRISYTWWNRAGLLLAAAYIAGATFAHHMALDKVKQFAAEQKLEVQAIGALPLPPSLWSWDGLVRGPRGVYEMRLDLTDYLGKPDQEQGEVITRTYYPDAPANKYTELARQLPEVQKVLWFARFPVIQFHMEGDVAVVEISDKRFPQIRRDRPASFTYRVRFAKDGKVLSQGWERG